MKSNRKSAKVVFLGAIATVAVVGMAGMNMRTLINSDQVADTARKASANDAVKGDVLENYTFTSDTAGIGVAGSITDYSQQLKQIKLLASAANTTVTMDLDDGYYTQIKVDTTEVYNKGKSAAMVGNAGTGDVLAGKTFTNASTVGATGTMANRGAVSQTINPGGSYTIPAGYHNGSGKVTANPNQNSGTYNATSRSTALDMGANNTYRYVNTNSLPNSNSGTYTFPANDTGAKKDLGATNTYRYVDATNVYNKGKADGENSIRSSNEYIGSYVTMTTDGYVNYRNLTVGQTYTITILDADKYYSDCYMYVYGKGQSIRMATATPFRKATFSPPETSGKLGFRASENAGTDNYYGSKLYIWMK